MPVITASGEEAVVTAWFVDEGGECTEGELLAEVQAEKVSAEVEAPGTGTVTDRVAINEPVPQGKPICRIAEGVGPKDTTPSAPGRVIASPSAKRLARELGVDLTGLAGTGPGGRVTETDVRAAGETSEPKTGGLRAVIARNMRRSHAETAPVTLHSRITLQGRPVSITASVVKTAARILGDHPDLNGQRDGDVFKPEDVAQISIAIQTGEGLVAPVVRDAATKSVEEIAAEIRDLADRAESGALTAEDYEGGTFSVSNLGAYGIEGFTPIINLPQVAILGVGAVRRVAVVEEDGSVSAGDEMVLSLSFDHAFVDGAPAAAFLQQLGEELST